jgi:Holliday junction resolvase RusA-like endonuclease
MINRFAFIVPGKPQPKQRARSGKGRHFTPAETKAYETLVMLSGTRARPQGWPLDGVYKVSAVFYWADRHRRDIDNTLKAIKDGLNGVAYADDHLVRSAVALAPTEPVAKGTDHALVIIERLTQIELYSEIAELEAVADQLGAVAYL